MNVNLLRWAWLPRCQRRGTGPGRRGSWLAVSGSEPSSQSFRSHSPLLFTLPGGVRFRLRQISGHSGYEMGLSGGEGHHPASLDLFFLFFFFFFCRTCRGGLTPGREVESNAPLKSLVFAFATSFFSFFLFPPLAIYHDHLSMPINIIIQHRKSFEIIEGR